MPCDTLCLVQDNSDSLKTHISQMANIFNNAILTIIAGDCSDASFGLPGLFKPRQLLSRLNLFDSGISLAVPHDSVLDDTAWAKRGWTLQESLFAKRKLTFVDNSVRFACSHSCSPSSLSWRHLWMLVTDIPGLIRVKTSLRE
ncbi:hypothetical protein QBC38DRAFT_482524 [Podospora fimiseda]|uniref:Heterokaryon incompatibility domain-containing protein n=1 Tax=Podospora fimiseda TaxID=252190 RepID=A0AAN7BLM9_9PEZI|nr:hypothetical protein QBC38DRAFT_482524 [Podospora fimiseda]